MDMQGFIGRTGIRFSYELAKGTPGVRHRNASENHDHFLCSLRGRMHEMTFHFSAPSGSGPPQAEDALRYLGALAAEYEDCEDIDEWAREHDLDPRDAETRDAYEAVARLARDLWQLVGADLYAELLKEIEIEQAVDMTLAGIV